MCDKNCEICNEKIDITKLGKYVKKPFRFCSVICANKYSSSFLKQNPKFKILKCSKCGKDFSIDSRARKGRCDECLYYSNCKICNIRFRRLTKNPSKICSSECRIQVYQTEEFRKRHSIRMKGKSGGYTPGAGNSKHGYFRGIYCGSTYELVWVIYRLDNNLSANRFEGYLKNEETGLIYYPDFIEDDGKTIYEMKGYWTKSVDDKTELAISKGYDVVLLYKEDLEFCFKWVKENYEYKDITELYDGSKPCGKYNYNCTYCDKEFNSRKPRLTDVYFCSRSCCLKHNRKKIHKN